MATHDPSFVSILAIGGYERSLRNSTAHLLCGDGKAVIHHPADSNKFLSLYKCPDKTDEYMVFDASSTQFLTVSDTCEPQFSSDTPACFKISTADCKDPNFLTASTGLCKYDCQIPYTIPTASMQYSSGYFYWSEKDTKLMVDTLENIHDIMVVENFNETNYKEASHFSLKCNSTTKKWDFIGQNYKYEIFVMKNF